MPTFSTEDTNLALIRADEETDCGNGGFQLEVLSISRVINHMTCYNSSALIGGKFIKKKS